MAIEFIIINVFTTHCLNFQLFFIFHPSFDYLNYIPNGI
jgi:hypothetical protein